MRILEAKNLRKAFRGPRGQSHQVLDGVSLALEEGEIVALLGRSGSGKSTLLRILAGLVPPDEGEVRYRGLPVRGPVPGVGMVFQSFALFPWLTVFENVELGLEARGVPKEERRRRVQEAIALIGLEGFESAYPKELSGGMRQRVGFARALVVEPDALFLDEAFSALDVLTAETLRNDLLDLWLEGAMPTRAILMVTHNIQEAVYLADRLLVLGSPGRILAERRVDLPHPRDPEGEAFRVLVEEVYEVLTRRPEAEARLEKVLAQRLPSASVGAMLGLLETLDRMGGRADLPELAEELSLEVDDLFPLLDALELLGFLRMAQGDVELTEHGRALARAETERRKQIFAEHLLQNVPLAEQIRRSLDLAPGHRLGEERFLELLARHFTPEEARQVLDTLIEWGRYAELFAYDDRAGVLYRD
ncbi:ABC transporter ATP-binding protein [Thermus filiformis]|uniref:Nitrate ABC transporter ATP-binding protein n=1 Tax=Thermus filiformis TaxID=276 RepID=A0A0A2WUT9_THEFI|nr:nitrate/sulfonate/bicarbonate ABC transporter ATP-binding protein [Thermus filiformis]KGQ22070.1 nitrate ABC transporter ATP-binding protein [Thermus filiformis]